VGEEERNHQVIKEGKEEGTGWWVGDAYVSRASHSLQSHTEGGRQGRGEERAFV
jgi:hypothetical protein